MPLSSPQGQRRKRRRRRKQKKSWRKLRRHRLFSLFQVLFWGRSLSSFGGETNVSSHSGSCYPPRDKMFENLCFCFSAAAVVGLRAARSTRFSKWFLFAGGETQVCVLMTIFCMGGHTWRVLFEATWTLRGRKRRSIWHK